MKRLIYLITLLLAPVLHAETFYISQVGGAVSGGTACNGHVANSASFFNSGSNWANPKVAGKIGPGDTVYLCGTFTGTANTTMLTFQNNGSSGLPINVLFDSNTQFNSPQWASSVGGTSAGAITLGNGRSWIVLDGQNAGIIQNTANGSRLANHAASTGISGFNLSNVTIKNLQILNLYVQVQGDPSGGFPSGITDNSVIRGIDFSGSNVLITGMNKIDMCGWCIFDGFGNGDTGVEISFSEISHFGHALIVATNSANAITNVKIHDINLHDTDNWANTAGGGGSCSFHDDGLHTFGTTGSSIDNFAFYNVWFHGNWGTCPTGFIFVEGGSGTPSHMKNSQWFNLVFQVENAQIVNTNGWFLLSSGDSGVQQVYNTTFQGPNATDNTLCIGIHGSSVNFRDNVINHCGDPISMQPTLATVGTNYYGDSCQNGANCFIWNGSFTGSFASWKTHCACDADSAQNNVLGLNADGSPTSTSPVIGFGANLSSLATGVLAPLASSTSKGNTIATVPRPGGSTLWTAGAYQVASGVSAPAAPTALSATPSGASVNLSWTASTGTPTITYTVQRATVNGGPYTSIASSISLTSYSDTGLANNTYYYVVSAQNAGGSSPNSSQASAVVATAAAANLTPASMNFGSNTVGTASPLNPIDATLTNTGTATLSSIVISFGGGGAADFSDTTTCGGTLAINASCVIHVSFTPSTTTTELATLMVASNDPGGTVSINLQGTGTGAVNIVPVTLGFGNVYVTKTSASQAITYTNVSSGSITVASIVFSGGDSGMFAESDNCVGVVTSGSSCTITVTFTPTSQGTKTSTLVITDNASGSPRNLPVTGTAKGHHILRIGVTI